MTRSILRLLASVAVILVLLVLRTQRAHASTFQVSPVRLPLSASATSGTITIANSSKEPVRLQLDAFAWSESATGQMQLQQTQDLVVFPALLTVPAGESRKVRIAAATPFAGNEKSYRVFVEELPPFTKSSLPGVVKVLTRMGIPVFLEPSSPVATPKVSAKAGADRVEVTVANVGTLHFLVRRIRLVGKDKSGKVLWEQGVNGWYVLAGALRLFTIARPSSSCSSLAQIVVEVQTDRGDVSTTLDQTATACP